MAIGLKRIVSGLFIAIVLCLMPSRADAALTALTVEQIRSEQPQIHVYCYDNADILDHSFQADCYLDGTQLLWLGTKDAGIYGTEYTILLDISGSIRQSYMDKVLEQIGTLADQMDPLDSITIITFGDDVQTLVSHCTDAAEVKNVLSEVRCTEQQTHLYEAFSDGIQYAESAGGQKRRIMLVVSDGIQVNNQYGITAVEIEEQLKNAGIPVFALCVDYAAADAKEQFGIFARTTGGSSIDFSSDNIDLLWSELFQNLASGKILCFESKNNLADGAEHTLLLKLIVNGEVENYTRTFKLQDWQIDTIIPQVEQVLYDVESNALRIIFSEPVQGADVLEHYCMEAPDGKYVTINSIMQDGDEYIISLDHLSRAGTYSLAIFGVTDCSMEQNPLSETTFLVTIVPPKQPAWWIVLCIGAALLLLALGVILFLFIRKKRYAKANNGDSANAKDKDRPVILPGNPKPENGESDARNLPAAKIKLCKVGPDGLTHYQEVLIAKSSIWGRSIAMCDVVIADKKVSNQHCAFNISGGNVYLSDLNSQNGTYLNGIRIMQDTRIRKGDVIRLGDTDIRIENLSVQQ